MDIPKLTYGTAAAQHLSAPGSLPLRISVHPVRSCSGPSHAQKAEEELTSVMALVATAGSLELQASAHCSLAAALRARMSAVERRAKPFLCAAPPPLHVTSQ